MASKPGTNVILPVQIDLCKPEELAFVESSFVSSTAQHYHRRMPADALYPWLRHRFSVMAETGTLLVASDDGVALGWIVGERRGPDLCVCGLYVKHLYRRMGVGGQLLAAADALLDYPGSIVYDTPTFRAGRKWAERLGARRL